MERLQGKSVIVTGAASGIGAATVVRMAEEGARVLAVDVDAGGLESTVAEAIDREWAGGTAVAHVADVSDEAAVKGTIAAAVEQFGKLDVLANMAGILRTSHTHECSTELWEKVIRINLTGTFLMCREALPHLLETRGNIVNAASTSSNFGHPWMAAYAASKGGVWALTHTLAVEYAKQGVRVNAVAPGSVDTGMTSKIEFPEGIDGKLIYRIMSPTGHGKPEDVAGVIAMLASSDGAHMTGEIIRIDGGTHA